MLPSIQESLSTELDYFFQAELSHLLQQPVCSFSSKYSRENVYGQFEPTMLFASSNPLELEPAAKVQSFDFRMAPLQLALQKFDWQVEPLKDAVTLSLTSPTTLQPPVWSLLHAAFPSRLGYLVQPPEILPFFCIENGNELLKKILSDDVLVLPFDRNLPAQFSKLSQHTFHNAILMGWGILVTGETVEQCISQYQGIIQCLAAYQPTMEIQTQSASILQDGAGTLRMRTHFSKTLGKPTIVSCRVVESETSTLPTFFPALPAQLGLLGIPSSDISDLLQDNQASKSIAGGFAFIAHDNEKIWAAAGDTLAQAEMRSQAFSQICSTLAAAQRIGPLAEISATDLNTAVNWLPKQDTADKPFSGEIAIVTGAASGIGYACAASLLERGCAVIGIDINPEILLAFHHPAFLGLVCDVSQENAVSKCIHTVAEQYGGVDILILNAGLFPGGCPIERLTLSEFDQVMNVNLNANLVLLREAYPYLKAAPRYGRVVVIGSKNTKAPGPGAAAYSASKAALTQLARVAALEWACDRIRVNVLHPDAVFDTALYTEDVLCARASHYGMSVEQYKKRNLLKTEITSHAVGELAAEMCGPLFEVITGAQIQIDGGNDRTI